MLVDYTTMQDAQQLHFFDECNIVTISGYTDSYGDYIQTEIVGSGILCGLEQTTGNERYGQVTIEDMDSIIRLPHNTVVFPKDKIRITSYRGIATNEDYEVLAALRGPTCVRALTKRLTYV